MHATQVASTSILDGDNPLTLHYLALRACAFVALTAGTIFLMALPYLA